MKIAVVGLQGAVAEHLAAVRKAMEKLGVVGEAVWASRLEQLSGADGIIIPGGESTTIGRLMKASGIFDEVLRLGKAGVPIMGTCAGMVLLAKRGDRQVERTGQPLLGMMDMAVDRNAFGRQRESFEAELEIKKLGGAPFHGVFIRAPAVREVWGDASIIAEFQGKIVGVKQKNMIALAFHPELTSDTRLHERFLCMC
ncbi:MAG: pyridoxal 5'-phosphate synthase glutaminase subunit PdxT [Candidatus Hadarchaeota archaeon]